MTVIAISSFAAASAVGLGIIAPALHAQGLEVIAAPTVTLGRHPGWGPPGGAATPDAAFASLLESAAAHPLAAEARWVLTGYFANAGQVEAAATLIETLKHARPGLRYVCDPVMGDAPKGLYVPPDVALALAARLLPLADVVTPNAWEAARLTGQPVADWETARRAAEALRGVADRPARLAAVTSTPAPTPDGGPGVGVTLASSDGVWLASGPQQPGPAGVQPTGRPAAWSGAGDLFAALCLVSLDKGLAPPAAVADAVGGVNAVLAASKGGQELVRSGLAAILDNAAAADLTRLA